MLYKELIHKRDRLDQVNHIADADAKFVYAVMKNKERMDAVIKTVTKMIAPDDELSKFNRELEELNRKHALCDSDGSIAYITVGNQQAYKKIIGMGNPNSDYSKALEQLRKKYKQALDIQEEKKKTYMKLLDTEVPADDYRIFWIDAEIIPNGLHPLGAEGCCHFIKELPEEDYEKKDKTKDVAKEKSVE